MRLDERMDALRAVPEKSWAGVALVVIALIAPEGMLPVPIRWGIAAVGLVLFAVGFVLRSQQQRQEMLDLLRKQQEQERPPAP